MDIKRCVMFCGGSVMVWRPLELFVAVFVWLFSRYSSFMPQLRNAEVKWWPWIYSRCEYIFCVCVFIPWWTGILSRVHPAITRSQLGTAPALFPNPHRHRRWMHEHCLWLFSKQRVMQTAYRLASHDSHCTRAVSWTVVDGLSSMQSSFNIHTDLRVDSNSSFDLCCSVYDL